MSINTIIIIVLIVMAVVGVAVITYLYLRDKTLDEIRADVYKLFLEAEHFFWETGSGQQKMKWVVSRARLLLPKWAQMFISDEFLCRVLECWFQAIKDLLDDGKVNGTEGV